MDLVKVKPGAGDDRFPVLFVSGTQEIRRVLSHSCVAPSQIPPPSFVFASVVNF